MEKIYVAKSYQNLEKVGDPYKVGNKRYIHVRMSNGSLKQVRVYSFTEYKKYYPDATPDEQKTGTQRAVFGFGDEGWIWVFKGDTYNANEWFKAAPTRFCKFWGWYLPSNMEMPEPLPANITPVKLYWTSVGKEDGWLKTDSEVKTAVEAIIYDSGLSAFQGSIGERIEVNFVCTKTFQTETVYGTVGINTFVDDEGNEYVWMTNARTFEEGVRYTGKGTVKAHEVYHGNNQTHLSRCKLTEMES